MARQLASGLWLGAGLALVEAEPDPYHIAAWGTGEGLPQSSVPSILQRRPGSLGVGTFGGVAKFDGVRFQVFDTTSRPPLPSDRILSLFEERAGALWLGTEEGTVARWDGTAINSFSPPNRGSPSKYI